LVEIKREGGRVDVLEGNGVDSLQALISAISAIRFALNPKRSEMAWLNVPGQLGLPLMVHEEDPDFLAVIEHTLAAEHARQTLAAKRVRKDNDGKPSR
jgi:hypothetical protein